MGKTISGIDFLKIQNSVPVKMHKSSEEIDKIQSPQDSVELSFNRQKEKELPAREMVKFNYYPQDRYTDKEPVIEQIEKSKIGDNLENDRMRIVDSKFPVEHISESGDYLFAPGQPGFDQVTAFVTANNTLEMHEENLGHEIRWAFADQKLNIDAHGSDPYNTSYYPNKSEVALGYNAIEKDRVFGSEALPDTVSHELGHASQDGIKPFYALNYSSELGALRESYADISSLLFTLRSDHNLKKIASETGGDLSKSNRLSMQGEGTGFHFDIMQKGADGSMNFCLRDANNNLKYKPASELPDDGPDQVLSREEHSYSRVLSGAVYDSIRNVYEKNLQGAEEQDIIQALKDTRDELGPVIDKAFEIAPPTGADFKTIGLCMLKTDQMFNNGKNNDAIKNAFIKHDIINQDDIDEFEKSNKNLSDLKFENLFAEPDEEFENDTEEPANYDSDVSLTELNGQPGEPSDLMSGNPSLDFDSPSGDTPEIKSGNLCDYINESMDKLADSITDKLTPESDDNLKGATEDSDPSSMDFSEFDAAYFLDKNHEKLGIESAADYLPKTIKDKYGYTIIEYSAYKDIHSTSTETEESLKEKTGHNRLMMSTGFTLTFDKDGALICKTEDKITEEKINETIEENHKRHLLEEYFKAHLKDGVLVCNIEDKVKEEKMNEIMNKYFENFIKEGNK